MDFEGSFAERRALLREGYIAGLPERLATMRAAVRADDRATLQREAHRLAGTGLSYGLPELTEWGQAAERKLKSGARLPELGEDLDALSDLIAAVIPRQAVG